MRAGNIEVLTSSTFEEFSRQLDESERKLGGQNEEGQANGKVEESGDKAGIKSKSDDSEFK